MCFQNFVAKNKRTDNYETKNIIYNIIDRASFKYR